jgi:glycine cleavage system H protein
MEDKQIYEFGRDKVKVPEWLRYTTSHLWGIENDAVLTIGVSDFFLKLVKEIYFISYDVEVGDTVNRGDSFGSVEGSKSVMYVKSPAEGSVIEINEELYDDPTPLNKNPYGDDGWLVKIKQSVPANLFGPKRYMQVLQVAVDEMEKKH